MYKSKIPDHQVLRKTKIICTIGPSSRSPAVIRELLSSGMNVARINASHGSMEEHHRVIGLLRREATLKEVPLAILIDLPGPKDRTGKLKKRSALIREGAKFILTTKDILGDETRVSVGIPELPLYVKKGQIIYLHDGIIKLEVTSVKQQDIVCKVITGGRISNNKGISVPGVTWDKEAITEDDWRHLSFAARENLDFVGLSFVKSADDVRKIKSFLEQNGSQAKVIAKIERPEALDNFDEILSVSDGIMVARGDLGIQIPIHNIPVVQKDLIRKCNLAGKPVIVATQMLESMVGNPVPTRAEVTDVANAIFDGTDAVMLSEETAIGKYVLETVNMMSQIAMVTEEVLPYAEIMDSRGKGIQPLTDDAISYAACHVAYQLHAKVIVAYTSSGSTARRVSRYRPQMPVLALTPNEHTERQLSLSWGVIAINAGEGKTLMSVFSKAARVALKMKLGKTGDLVVVTAGVPVGMSGSTNMLKVERI